MKDLLLPVGLAVIMLSLGLSLTIDDFKRALLYPKAVGAALVCQIFVVPAFCFTIVKIFHLSPELAVGMMLLSATAGGTLASLYSYLGGGDLALNITLTAVNTLLIVVSLPITLDLSLHYFFGVDQHVSLPVAKILGPLVIVLVPPLIGMYLRHLKPRLAIVLDRPIRIAAAAFLIAIGVMLLYTEWRPLIHYFPSVGAAVVLFDVACLTAGYGLSMWARLGRKQAIAISLEVGVHNAALASGIALSPLFLNSPLMAIPPLLSGILSVFIAGAFTILINTLSRKSAISVP